LADLISAQEAADAGFVLEVVAEEALDAKAAELCTKLARLAPVTQRVSKEAIRRVVADAVPEGDDLIRACYGSRDFKIGVNAFLDKKRPEWTGT
ncbi:enoyl-CoA hydratase, partial [Oxalobacteraceae bacterium OM1]